VRFQDKDFSMRKPDPQFEKIKSMETLCMAAGKVNPKLKSYVVCSGMVYGEGERLFAEYFMQARMQKPPALTYYSNGKNRVPMVHIEDLVTYVEKVI
jgi:nucleoside-diphosphate-sugar epimerase